LHIDKDHHVLFVGGPIIRSSNIADGRHIEKVKSPCLGNDSADRHDIWRGDVEWPSLPCQPLMNIEFFKFILADGRHFGVIGTCE